MIYAFVRGSDRLFKAALTTSAVVALTLAAAPADAAAGEHVTQAADVFVPVAPSSSAQVAPIVVPASATMAPIPNDASDSVAIVRARAEAPVKASSPAVVSQGDEHCLATAIYFEARGESEKGQLAVAEVIVARTKTPGRPSTICGVVYEGSHRKTGCQFSFTCDRSSDVAPMNEAWSRARRIAGDVMNGAIDTFNSVVRGATFYHANYVKPGWASRMDKVAQVGTHIFYRPKRGRYM